MKFTGLQKKATLVVIIPLIIGVIITAGAGVIPWFTISSEMLENYTSHMIDNQKGYLQNRSFISSKIASATFLQQFANSVNIGGDLMQKYYFYSLKIKDLNYSSILTSYNQYTKEFPSDSILYNQSFWFYKNFTEVSELQKEDLRNFNISAMFDPVLKAISLLNHKYYRDIYISSYLVYSLDGFYLRNPSELTAFNIPNCLNSNDSWYDPRCSKFYDIIQKEKGVSNAVITSPYMFGEDGYGQTACRAQWNYTISKIIMAYCIDFNQSQSGIVNPMENYQLGDKHIYSYIVASDASVLEYKGIFNFEMLNKSIVSLEIKPSEKSERNYFNKHIMPLLLYENTKLTHYFINGSKVIISISPIMLTLSYNSKTHFASIALVIKNDELEDKFNKLKSNCKEILLNEIFVSVAALVLIIIFCGFLTNSLTKSLISPIDNLLIILNRMIGGDLEVNIMASLKPSPTEILDLYEVFDKLRVVLRFASTSTKDLTQASLIYIQALNLFIQFGNYKAMEICYRELGYIYAKKKIWPEASVFLYNHLQLAEKSGETENLDLIKKKIDAAEVMCKTKEYKKDGLLLLNESLEGLKKLEIDQEICELFLKACEIFYETGKKNRNFFWELRKSIEDESDGIVMQRFLYVKGLLLRNNGKVKEACEVFVMVLEEFEEYVPGIRVKIIVELQKVFGECEVGKELSKYNPAERSQNKDVVIIMSSSLAHSSFTYCITDFIQSIMTKNDRLSIIQFHSRVKLLFNLTKSPMNLLKFKKFSINSSTFLLFDALTEGIKQIELKKNFLLSKNRQSYMLILTDVNDSGSFTNIGKLCQDLSILDVCVIFVTLNTEISNVEQICSGNDFSLVFEVPQINKLEMILRDVEAYLCPEKEVFYFNGDIYF